MTDSMRYSHCTKIAFLNMIPPMYTIMRLPAGLDWSDAWDDPSWRACPVVRVDNFHPSSSEHRPDVRVRLAYDEAHLYGIFHVDDRYVLSKRTAYQDRVSRDSCVEVFVQPKADAGSFNFEFNAGGALLLCYIEDATVVPPELRTGDLPFRKGVRIPWKYGANVRIEHSLPEVVWPERTEPVLWTLSFAIPLAILEHYCGPLRDPAGQVWRGNFYKCADDSSHPHWAAWAPVGEVLNFHRPEIFGALKFK